MTLRAAVFASGTGSNFQALADHATSLWDVALLISDQGQARALTHARERNLPAQHIPVSGRDVGDVERDTLRALEEEGIDIVLLAGYLRLIPPGVVARFRGRMLNLHPALLPAFGGRGMYGRAVHEAVIAAGVRVSGVTIHIVDEEYDRGRIVAQWPVPVFPDDTPRSLAARIQEVEHCVFPLAVDELARALTEGRSPLPLPTGAGHFHFLAGPPLCEGTGAYRPALPENPNSNPTEIQ